VFALSLASLTVRSAATDSSRPLIFVTDGDVWCYASGHSSVAYSENNALTIDNGRDVQTVITAEDSVAVWDWGTLEYRIKH
jgi:hypothetical protein